MGFFIQPKTTGNQIARTAILFFLLWFGFQDFTSAQSFYARRMDRPWMFSYGVGSSSYHGDLHSFLYDKLGEAFGTNLGIGLRRKVDSQLSIRLDFNYYSNCYTDWMCWRSKCFKWRYDNGFGTYWYTFFLDRRCPYRFRKLHALSSWKWSGTFSIDFLHGFEKTVEDHPIGHCRSHNATVARRPELQSF